MAPPQAPSGRAKPPRFSAHSSAGATACGRHPGRRPHSPGCPRTGAGGCVPGAGDACACSSSACTSAQLPRPAPSGHPPFAPHCRRSTLLPCAGGPQASSGGIDGWTDDAPACRAPACPSIWCPFPAPSGLQHPLSRSRWQAIRLRAGGTSCEACCCTHADPVWLHRCSSSPSGGSACPRCWTSRSRSAIGDIPPFPPWT